MPAPKRSFRADDETWQKIGVVAERCGITRSELLRRAGTQTLEGVALASTRHYLSECALSLIKIRDLIEPYAFGERGRVAADHGLDEIIFLLRTIALMLRNDSMNVDLAVEDLPNGLERQVEQIRAMRRAAEDNASLFG